jgi:hypothetical protein
VSNNLHCPVCGKEATTVDSASTVSVGMCPDHECEGGALMHVPKGFGPAEFLLHLAVADRMLQNLTKAAIDTTMRDVTNPNDN